MADTQGPSLSASWPAAGTELAGPRPFAASVADPSGVERVELRLGDEVLHTDETAPFEFVLDPAGLPPGEHTFTLVARDTAGNSTSISRTFLAPAPAPQWQIDGPTVSWSQMPGATRYKIAYRQGPGAATGYVSDQLSAPASSHTFDAPPAGLSGPFEVAWAYHDGSDHWTDWRTISVAPADTQGPSLSASWPAAGSTLSQATPVVASASDPSGVERVELSRAGEPVATDAQAPFEFTLDPAGLPAGEHSFTLTARDTLGNPTSLSRTFVVQAAPAPGPAAGTWEIEGTTVRWGQVSGATRYKIAYRQGPGAATGYVSDQLSAPASSYTFAAPPSGLSNQFQVAWAYNDGADHWTDWRTISVAGGSDPDPEPEPEPGPGPAPPPSGGGTLLWSQSARTITCQSGAHTCTNDFVDLGLGKTKLGGVNHFEMRYGVAFPAAFRWSTGGFKTPGPGGASSGPVPNGCQPNTTGWSARLQWDGAGNRARVAAYPYLLTRNPPELNGLDVQATGTSEGPCGTIIRPTGSVGWVNAGESVEVSQRIQLNTPGVANGRLRVWLDDELIIDHPQLRFNDTAPLTHAIPVWYFGGTNTSPQTQSFQQGQMTLTAFS